MLPTLHHHQYCHDIFVTLSEFQVLQLMEIHFKHSVIKERSLDHQNLFSHHQQSQRRGTSQLR